MKYSFTLDKDGYILMLKKDEDGIEFNPHSIDLSYLNCYKVVDDKVVLDEEKKNLIDSDTEKALEIAELKEYLVSTSDVDNDFIEQLFSLNNPLTFVSDLISLMSSYKTTYKTILSERKKARDRLKELESH